MDLAASEYTPPEFMNIAKRWLIDIESQTTQQLRDPNDDDDNNSSPIHHQYVQLKLYLTTIHDRFIHV